MLLRRLPPWLLSAGLWTLIGVVSGVQIWISMITHGHSLARVVACQMLVWVVWTPFGYAIAALLRRAPLLPPRPWTVLLHLLVAAVLGVAHALWWVAAEFVIVPYDWMNPTDFGIRFQIVLLCQLPLTFVLYALVVTAVYATDYYRRYREREVVTAQLEASLAEARLQALEVQIQPHFLFNTLNAISALVRVGQNDQAVAMIAGLSDLLRYALDRAGEPLVRLEEEIAVARRYLEIQQLRFEDRMRFDIDVPAAARRVGVPALLLQPLVENAVSHGIASRDTPGRVSVKALREGDRLVIEVWNTGSLPRHVRHGIGLTNTRARLEQRFGDRHGFEMTAHDDGVRVRIWLPWDETP